ncbi:hypothetical protein LZ318_34035 [Saccharopolyspora indica]|uniref:hypothetical protein n=1 Tax=Saccharopolyspora indica TaxID=1229659 RepID=UPI0022EA66B9|nr:hypothetical protein [Saccharopolyspora indica]MDA3647487.1 hypothetical protein [Saccharopolyspora indica]
MYDLTFELSGEWTPVPAERFADPGVVMAAQHGPSRTGFTANIVVTTVPGGLWAAEADWLAQLAESYVAVCLLCRNEFGTADTPGCARVVRLRSAGTDVVQTQVLVEMAATAGSIVVRMALTCTPDQLDEVLPDFEDFVGSIRPAPLRD